MKFPDKVYDVLKWLCLIALPALNAFLGAILPGCGVETDTIKLILTIISAVIAFIGALIGISTANYNKENK